jgi:hypothetical protein
MITELGNNLEEEIIYENGDSMGEMYTVVENNLEYVLFKHLYDLFFTLDEKLSYRKNLYLIRNGKNYEN